MALPQNLPSPTPSNFSSSFTGSPTLPHPRSQPLKAGSVKEAAARRYIENRLLHISRRYVKKFQEAVEGEMVGYVSGKEICGDLEEVVDVLWLSSSPHLQIPYLLNLAGSIPEYVSSFPPEPKATFTLLGKLDHVFVSLLRGQDSVTSERLPGFAVGEKAFSGTDMVRLKSIVEDTRVVVVDVMEGFEDDEESEMETETDDMDSDGNGDADGESMVSGGNGLAMNVAKVYAGTVVQLGTLLSGDTPFDAWSRTGLGAASGSGQG